MKANITIRGNIARPYYSGYVKLPGYYGPISESELKRIIVEKLNRTSYQVDKLRTDEIKIHSVEF
jgi:hypothetical protein